MKCEYDLTISFKGQCNRHIKETREAKRCT
jgi:hypothetical protein